jgi:glutamyl-tRNA synthetase
MPGASGGAERVTRLAPSPTGALHLGNARTFLINWAMARAGGWHIILRIEDLDGPRIKRDAAAQAIDILTWLGMDWDEGPIFQSHDLAPYEQAMDRMTTSSQAFSCDLTRTEIEAAASAPHPTEQPGELHFPPELRPPLHPAPFDARGAATNWRFVTDDTAVQFDDVIAGPQRHVPGEAVGDFVIWTKRGQPAYQLAVVVDDHRQGVTDVVRGADLLDSTARQLLLYRALGFAPEPHYVHLPLVVGPDGRRLAKRHGDTRLVSYRRQGVGAERVVGLLAHWSGIGERQPMTASEFADRFNLSTMPRETITFSDEDETWLRA